MRVSFFVVEHGRHLLLGHGVIQVDVAVLCKPSASGLLVPDCPALGGVARFPLEKRGLLVEIHDRPIMDLCVVHVLGLAPGAPEVRCKEGHGAKQSHQDEQDVEPTLPNEPGRLVTCL